jgi:hypothetical protein
MLAAERFEQTVDVVRVEHARQRQLLHIGLRSLKKPPKTLACRLRQSEKEV